MICRDTRCAEGGTDEVLSVSVITVGNWPASENYDWKKKKREQKGEHEKQPVEKRKAEGETLNKEHLKPVKIELKRAKEQTLIEIRVHICINHLHTCADL